MAVLLKKLVANELGEAGGHQRGGVLIPRPCITFFPPLKGDENPETTISVAFSGHRYPLDLRVIHYDQSTRNEYRLTPIPHDILRSAAVGDILVIRDEGGRYAGEIVRARDARHAELLKRLGGRAGRVTPDLPAAP